MGQLWDSIRIEPDAGDGIQVDGSFYQHGPLLQTASYGNSYTASMVSLFALANGTDFDATADAIAAFAVLVLDGQQARGRVCREPAADGGVLECVTTVFVVCHLVQHSLRTAADGSKRTSWDLLPRGREIVRAPGTATDDLTHPLTHTHTHTTHSVTNTLTPSSPVDVFLLIVSGGCASCSTQGPTSLASPRGPPSLLASSHLGTKSSRLSRTESWTA